MKKKKTIRIDPLSPKERSERMALVRSTDTKPEMFVRRLIYSMNFRYRLHDRRLPGCPDLTFAKRRKAIFVHGCFWHRHDCPNGKRLPKTKLDFWLPKLDVNKKRDIENKNNLKKLGWSVMIIWECQLKNQSKLKRDIREFLVRP